MTNLFDRPAWRAETTMKFDGRRAQRAETVMNVVIRRAVRAEAVTNVVARRAQRAETVMNFANAITHMSESRNEERSRPDGPGFDVAKTNAETMPKRSPNLCKIEQMTHSRQPKFLHI